MKRLIAINGQFTARRMTGQERFAYQLVTELDKYTNIKNFILIVPSNAKNIPILYHIRIIKYGKAKGSLWEQSFFAFFCLRHHCISLNLCSIMPLLSPGIICIHDLSYKVHPEYCKTIYAKVSQIWHKVQYHFAWRFSPLILTVSEYSKNQMQDIYHVDPKRICVLGNGWDHFEHIIEDDSVFIKRKELFNQPYFFILGSLAPNKNIPWILNVALKYPQYNFLIGGNANLKASGTDYKQEEYTNVHFLGYISDGYVKSLMKHCRAFIFPSFFEGFGIPPLEALSVGAEVIVSKVSCLPEIFGNSVHYIDPYHFDVDLEQLLKEPIGDANKILEKYRFPIFAEKLVKTLNTNKIIDRT